MFFIKYPPAWAHHRGSWQTMMESLKEYSIEGFPEMHFYLEDTLRREPILRPWFGFVHRVPFHPNHAAPQYKKTKDLNKVIQGENFIKSLPYCKCIFTVSQYLTNFLQSHLSVNVHTLIHPIIPLNFSFSMDNFSERLINVGYWMRNLESIFYLKSPYKKYALITNDDHHNDLKTVAARLPHLPISFLPYASGEGYDRILSNNIIFADYYDVAASNTILECMTSNTPILLNRLPGAEEYLGKDYPFFYSSLGEASRKLKNIELVKQTSDYLKCMDKKKFSIECFNAELLNIIETY